MKLLFIIIVMVIEIILGCRVSLHRGRTKCFRPIDTAIIEIHRSGVSARRRAVVRRKTEEMHKSRCSREGHRK